MAASINETREWIKVNETAKEMLNRIFTERPFLLLPLPLHRLPLRSGNVLEIVGPSPSSKTHILMQAAINCILPKEYGGMERLVMFIDLDCNFDISRFSQLLKLKLTQANYNGNKTHKELFQLCMRRFLYIRCYNSFEYLATLKTMNYQLQKQKEIHGVGVHLLMIDNIGAFYWMDRGISSLPNKRKSFSLQNVSESVVEEIQRLLLVHPMVVLATKTASFVDKHSTSDVRNRGKWAPRNSIDERDITYREYMPSVWQSFVTHRILLRTSENHIHSAEWLLPPLKTLDRFSVTNEGILSAL